MPASRIVSRSNNREVQARLCSMGVGLAVLPIPLGEPPPGRDTWTWIGYHRDMRRWGRLRALVELAIARLAK